MKMDRKPLAGMDDVSSRTKRIIARIAGVHVEELLDDIRFREEAGVDSMMGLEILAACEREFSIVINEADIAEIATIGDFLDRVLGLTGADAASKN
jgi:acyl carrier protein